MAKGNNGNLLQHAIEAAVASELAKCEKGLHFVFTHGMEPYEPFEPRKKNASVHRLLDHWMRVAATESMVIGEQPVVTAYRRCRASELYYPNSAEVVSSLVADVEGVITEVDPQKYQKLSIRWRDSTIAVKEQSWRKGNAEVMHTPPQDKAWLISMDPMIFSTTQAADDNKLRASDLELVKVHYDRLAAIQANGALLVFCYSMQPETNKAFQSTTKDKFANAQFIETTALGGNKHVVAICSPDATVAQAAMATWSAIESASIN